MTPLENKLQFEQLTGDGFELDVTSFILTPESRKSLLSLRASAMLDKVNLNSVAFADRPQELMEALRRSDVELMTFDYLLDLDITNHQITTSEKKNASN